MLRLVTCASILMLAFSQPEVEVVSVDDLREPIPQHILEEYEEEERGWSTTSPPVVETSSDFVEKVVIEEAKEPELPYSEEEIELIALLTMAEAEGESEKGKRLVIDTVLNRVDHEYFPDTVTEVVYQEGQFSAMWNGRVDKCYVSDDICKLVRQEMQHRTDSRVIFFRVGDYSSYGEPLFALGNHYFSSYS